MPLCVPAPLEDRWEAALAASLDRRVDPKALAVMVGRQSARYRGENVPLAHGDALTARTLFWFPRDLLKVALPVEELLAAGALPERPLRILDLGAGVGATSFGVIRALRDRRAVAHVTALDSDPQALALLRRVLDAAAKASLLPRPSELVTEVRDLSAADWDRGLDRFDLVTVGLSLVEVTRGDDDRAARLAALLTAALAHVADDGALLVIEPATREEARALQGARDALVAGGVTVFAPCPHTRACPMLPNPRDWCHDDLPDVALPPWLVPIARAAGLRWEGLTFSYLTLRRDARTFASAVTRPGRRALRLLSAPIETKGKTEVIVCGDVPQETATVRLLELAREAKHAEVSLTTLARGEVIAVDDEALAAPGKTARVKPGQWHPRGS
jgi:SAM-dependent methyltransferase